MAGYNVYRSTGASSGYVKLNTGLIDSTEYVDLDAAVGTNAADAAATVYYYVVTAVDDDGLESVQSASVSPAMDISVDGGNSARGPSGCFFGNLKSERSTGLRYRV